MRAPSKRVQAGLSFCVMCASIIACGNGSSGTPAKSGAGAGGLTGTATGGGGNIGGSGNSAGTADEAGAQIQVPSPTRIALGIQYGCAIDSSGAIRCWGTPLSNGGQTTPPTGQFSTLAALVDVSCAVAAASNVECWGNISGAAADPIPSGLLAKTLGVGISEQCAVTNTGDLRCWGAAGVLTGTVPSGPYEGVGVGRNFACVLKQDGTLGCWGSNVFGESTPPSGQFIQLATGEEHTCALHADGTVACWGMGNSTMPTDGGDEPDAASLPDQDRPWGQATPPSGKKFVRIAVGLVHSCGILESGDITCWGAGQTQGDCSTIDTCGQAIAQTGPFTELALGYSNSCGILSSGKIKCWGSDSGGRSTPPADFR